MLVAFKKKKSGKKKKNETCCYFCPRDYVFLKKHTLEELQTFSKSSRLPCGSMGYS